MTSERPPPRANLSTPPGPTPESRFGGELRTSASKRFCPATTRIVPRPHLRTRSLFYYQRGMGVWISSAIDEPESSIAALPRETMTITGETKRTLMKRPSWKARADWRTQYDQLTPGSTLSDAIATQGYATSRNVYPTGWHFNHSTGWLLDIRC